MPTRNVNLTAEQDAFIETMVKAGAYQNASEAVRDAVRGLQARWEERGLRLRLLRRELGEGIAALEAGDFVEVADDALDVVLDGLGREDL